MNLFDFDPKKIPPINSPQFRDFVKKTKIYKILETRIYKQVNGFISAKELIKIIANSIIKNIVFANVYARKVSPSLVNGYN